MLGVSSRDLSQALTERVIAARGDVVQKTHSRVEADYGRDALAKVNFVQVCLTSLCGCILLSSDPQI